MRNHYQFTYSDDEQLRWAGLGQRRDATQTLTVDDDGIAILSGNAQTRYRWTDTVGIEEHGGGLLLLFDNLSFYPIAATAFADQCEREQFLAHVRFRITPHVTPSDEPPEIAGTKPVDTGGNTVDDVHPPARAAIATAPGYSQNLNNAIRFAFFQRVPTDAFPVSWAQVRFFSLLSLTPPLLWALASVGISGSINWHALPDALFHLPILLFVAIGIGHLTRSVDKTLALFLAFLMIEFAIDVIYYALAFGGADLQINAEPTSVMLAIYVGCASWAALACAVAAIRLTGVTTSLRGTIFVACGVLIALPLAGIDRDRSLWVVDDTRDNIAALVNRDDITAEDNFYRQPALLEQELAAVLPQRKGIADLYFIGVAGYGAQDVFRREIDSVTALMRQRFYADGRTIRLINNGKTASSAPLASVTSLRASLMHVGALMDKEEDVLLLYLTSHGSETHRFSLEVWPLRLKELDPVLLRSLLDESGIKHRVVVVSACYSGGFINALKNDDTLVITASAADRNSFGCSNENHWTYFGRAYFDEALRKTYSFIDAFEIARPVIAAREKEQEYEPSNPQISVGRNIASTLARWQAQLEETNRARVARTTSMYQTD